MALNLHAVSAVPTPTLDRFLKASTMTINAILTVPVANLSAAALELAFSNLETAKLLAEIESVRPRSTTQDAGSVLAEEAKLKRLRDREPWQTAIENAAAERTDISLQTQLEQRELFVALAKAHALTPEDTMALTYSLYGTAFFFGIRDTALNACFFE